MFICPSTLFICSTIFFFCKTIREELGVRTLLLPIQGTILEEEK
jgi:hypothetical protein